MEIIGHRGCFHEDIENTIPCFEKAIEAGVDRVELDVHRIATGELVVHHDYDLTKFFGRDDLLVNMKYADLSRLKYANGSSIPTLGEVIELCKSKTEINIEIKDKRVDVAKDLADVISAHDVSKEIIVSSFMSKSLLEFKRFDKSTRVAFLLSEKSGVDWNDPSVLGVCRELGTNIIHPVSEFVVEDFMAQMKKENMIVYPYTSTKGEEEVDREKTWSRLVGLEIHGLCTNYPRELIRWLSEHN